jgi:NRPS condensation-like uncharacterized protein
MSDQPGSQHRVGNDPVQPWFEALEQMGEFIGIRFGRVASQTKRVEWHFKKHSEFDGIGGFANLLRSQGIVLDELPQTPHRRFSAWTALIRAMPRMVWPRKSRQWRADLPKGTADEESVAWHLFNERETKELIARSKEEKGSVNSLLLKYLDQAIRPFLVDPSLQVSWMVPVNLRGRVESANDEVNHSSYLSVRLKEHDSVVAVHRAVHRCIQGGQHWASWSSLALGKFLPNGFKKWILRTDRATLESHLGGFSNLGVWNEQSLETEPEDRWLFCPPVLRNQQIGAGCITYRGHLSVMVQLHPDLTTDKRVSEEIVGAWVNGLTENKKK